MDAVCKVKNTKFSLQAQQLFLREYMRKVDWRSLLLYHEIGSGKTCTAITMAEEYLKSNPTHKVKIVLPARLRTNFLDEIISPCGLDAYITPQDFALFNAPTTDAAQKSKIKSVFMAAITQNYDIMSFEKLKSLAKAHHDNLKAWVDEFTKDAMIIIDEVHNLINDKYNIDVVRGMLVDGKIDDLAGNAGSRNSLLFKFITHYAHPSCKMVFLTATPIFDNIKQLKDVVEALNPSFNTENAVKVADLLKGMRGKVSYFPGTSANAYPKVEFKTHVIQASPTQIDILKKIASRAKIGDIDYTDSFLAKERQVLLSVKPMTLDNLSEYAPKVKAVVDNIVDHPGKHLVFSNFIQSGLNIVAAALDQRGWKSMKEALLNPSLFKSHSSKIYARWDGAIKDADKQHIKIVVNSLDNIAGQQVRVILGSPSIKEGVSFKHIQHMHMLDPVWSYSAKTQVEGRAIRFCSHSEIDEKADAPLRRLVKVHLYKCMADPKDLDETYADNYIYEKLMPLKMAKVAAGERALKRIAIDHYLFRDLYAKNKPKPNPKTPVNIRPSPLGIANADNVDL